MADNRDLPSICGVLSCGKTTNKKPHLECQECLKLFHTACLGKAWADISTVNDLKKMILSRNGLRWYCSDCEPKIRDYVHSTEISAALMSMDSKVESLTQLICANHQALTISYRDQAAKSPKKPSTSNNDEIQHVRKLVENVDTKLKAQRLAQDKLSRSLNVVIHNLEERNDTMANVSDVCQNLHFSKYLINQVTRIGQRNMADSNKKPRPTKISFSAAIHRDEFLKRFNTWEGRGVCFCTADHDKAERDREYALRQERNKLQLSNSNNYYQVRNGAIFTKPKQSGKWEKLDTKLTDLTKRIPSNPGPSSESPSLNDTQPIPNTPLSPSDTGVTHHDLAQPSTPFHSISSTPADTPNRLDQVLITPIGTPSH